MLICDNWREMYLLHIFTVSKIEFIRIIPFSISEPQSLYKRTKRAAI